MKKILSLLALTLVLVCAMSSCANIRDMFGGDTTEEPEPTPPQQYTVNINLGGAELPEGFAESLNVKEGETVTLPTLTKENYTFLGWYINGQPFTEGTKITADSVITAEWERITYTVTFDLDGGELPEGASATVTVNAGDSLTLFTPTKENHDFLGWLLNGKPFDGEALITSDATLTASWFQNNIYTVTYDTADMVEVESAVVIKGEAPVIPETPVVDGYVFFGWYLDSELTERYFFDSAFEEDLTLYAKFYDTTLGEYNVISNLDQLMAIKDAPEAKYLLACDINCKGETLAPIPEFSGELEGNGFKIHNFSINTTAASAGLIINNKGTIKDLSFGDFTYDVLTSASGQPFYGVVSAYNNGLIENCHVLDSKIKIIYSIYAATTEPFIGAITGYNYSEVTRCTNNSTMDLKCSASGYHGWSGTYNGNIYSYVGGIVGCSYNNTSTATVSNCVNTGTINMNVIATGDGNNMPRVGGIVAKNGGDVSDCSNLADINLTVNETHGFELYLGAAFAVNEGTVNKCYSTGNVNIVTNTNEVYRVGGFVAKNTGTIENSYSKGEVVIDSAVGANGSVIGGFVAHNTGKLYNCYTATNITDNNKVAHTAVGGFVGFNELVSGYEGLINKCFTVSNITLGAQPTDSGYLVGKTTATEKDTYYLDTMTFNVVTKTETEVEDPESETGFTTEIVETTEAVAATCNVGTAKNYEELTSVKFLANTLYFDRMIWFVTEGILPTLR